MAQDFAGFRGTITDPTGAAVAGAQIKVTEEKLGQSQGTTSNELGEYELRGIPPGTYTIEVTAPTFKTFQNTGVVVYARDIRRVNVELEVGPVTTSVTVEAEGSRIQTDSASIQYKTANQEVYALNIQSSLIYLVSLNPGAESRNQVHGGFANNTNAEQDGIATNAYGSADRAAVPEQYHSGVQDQPRGDKDYFIAAVAQYWATRLARKQFQLDGLHQYDAEMVAIPARSATRQQKQSRF